MCVEIDMFWVEGKSISVCGSAREAEIYIVDCDGILTEGNLNFQCAGKDLGLVLPRGGQVAEAAVVRGELGKLSVTQKSISP